MKCEKCFFCTRIGQGIYGEYPVKYCKYHKAYKIPFIQNDDGTETKLDLTKQIDLKIWRNAGCDIHPSKVAKAKRDTIKALKG